METKETKREDRVQMIQKAEFFAFNTVDGKWRCVPKSRVYEVAYDTAKKLTKIVLSGYCNSALTTHVSADPIMKLVLQFNPISVMPCNTLVMPRPGADPDAVSEGFGEA